MAATYRNSLGLFFSALIAALFLLIGCSATESPHQIGWAGSAEQLGRGAQLVRGLAACGYCHGQSRSPDAPLSGGLAVVDLYGQVAVPNITPAKSGIGEWQAQEVMRALRGTTARGAGSGSTRELSPQVHRGYEWMSDEDALAVVSYLRSVPPVENNVEQRSVSFFDRNTKGFFEPGREVRGYVPALNRRYVLQYGQYLVDNVARCGYCHSAEPGLIENGEYLGGGRNSILGADGVAAPNITASKSYGIGAWTEAQIVQYFKGGVTPQGEQITAEHCPTAFYRLADDQDLAAVAAFLKSVPGR